MNPDVLLPLTYHTSKAAGTPLRLQDMEATFHPG